MLELFQIMASKTLKNPFRLLRQRRSNFPRRGQILKYGKENGKLCIQCSLVMAFLAAENENHQMEDLPQADFGRLLLSVRTKSIKKDSVF